MSLFAQIFKEASVELFEDLDFKPMTEGLGFHRNAPTAIPAAALKSQTPQAPVFKASDLKVPEFKPSEFTPQNLIPPPEMPKVKLPMKPAFVASLKPEYNFLDEASMSETKKFAQELTQPKSVPDRTKIYEPIGRKEYTSPTLAKSSELAKQPHFGIPIPGAPASLSALRKSATAQPAFPLPTKALTQKINVSTASTLNAGQVREVTLASAVPAAILDGVFAFGVSLILLVGVLLMTKADLVGLLSNSTTDRFVQFQLGILFLMVLQMYTLVSRSTLFGQTIGEWTYETQLGTDEQRAKAIYPVQVVFRGVIFALTGFFLIPLLSELFGKDLATPLCGLAIYKKNNGTK